MNPCHKHNTADRTRDAEWQRNLINHTWHVEVFASKQDHKHYAEQQGPTIGNGIHRTWPTASRIRKLDKDSNEPERGLHCTALGKVLIARLPELELDHIIRRQGMIRYNENTIVSMKKLRMACSEIQQLGYAIDDEEEEIGVRCIGAPVCNSMGEVVAAISISGTKAQMEDILVKAARVTETALALSHHLSPLVYERQQPFAS